VNLGVAAAGVLSAFGGAEPEDESEQVSRQVGAMIAVHIWLELETIRKALTSKA
jgi:hypothetical protein